MKKKIMRALTAVGYVLATICVASFLSLAVGSGHLNINETGRMKSTLTAAANSCALAEKHDRNPLVAVIHASEGLSASEGLRRLLGDDTIKKRCGMDVGEVIQRCHAAKRVALRRMRKVAPSVALNGDLAAWSEQ